MRIRSAPIVLALLLAGCGDGGGPTVTTTTPATTTAAATTAAATTTTATTAPATTTTSAPGSTTTAATCRPFGALTEVSVRFPDVLSRLVGTDIRVGARPCAERIVIELASFDPAVPATLAEMPGYWVRYQERPIIDSPRGEPVDVLGAAVLVVTVGSWMGDMEGNGYAGPRDVRPTNVRHIRQLLQIENFEGMTQWAVGLDAAYPFTVFTLDGPPRLVIDLATG